MKSIDEIKKVTGITSNDDAPYVMGYINIGGDRAAFVSYFTPDDFKFGKTTIVATRQLTETEIQEVIYKFFLPDNGLYVVEQTVSPELRVYDFFDSDRNESMEVENEV